MTSTLTEARCGRGMHEECPAHVLTDPLAVTTISMLDSMDTARGGVFFRGASGKPLRNLLVWGSRGVVIQIRVVICRGLQS